MSIDLSHPDELDWMARGRRGEIRASRFSETVSDEELEQEAERSLAERMVQRLVERDLVEHPDRDDAFDRDELVTAVRRILSAVGDERRRGIEEDVWQALDRADDRKASFVDEYETRVADRVLDAYFAERSGPNASAVAALAD